MESSQHPLDAILGSSDNGMLAARDESVLSDSIVPENEIQPYGPDVDCPAESKPTRASGPILQTLNLSGLKSPAIVLDDCLRVAWQNKPAIDLIWYRSRTANNGNPTPDIFDLLFDPQFQGAVDNWRQWVVFFIQQVIGLVSADLFHRRLDKMRPRHKDIVRSIYDRQKAEHWQSNVVSSHMRQILSNGEIRVFDVTGVDFVEGRLLVFVADTRETAYLIDYNSKDLIRRYENVRSHPNPVHMEFCVLSGCLADASSLKTEMLPDEFCRLVNELCNRCLVTVERFGGAFVRNSDRGFAAYFLPFDESDEGSSTNSIRCALALKAQMAELSREWKIRKSWLHDIELNIGIHRESEYVGILTTSLGDSLTSFGSALSIASELAHASPKGQIWATKLLVNGLPLATQSQLRFGITRPDNHRQPVLIPSCFAALQSLHMNGGLLENDRKDLEGIAVTRIFDFQITA